MNPIYFGPSDRPLYGVIHEPTDGPFRSNAILICQPCGHEYFRTHRSLQQLASQLANQGYYVFRFDYQGSGDSSGEFSEQTLEDWKHSTQLASEELLSISGATGIDVIGIRMGANLLLSLQETCFWQQKILWDPIVSGAQHLETLAEMQTAALEGMWHFNKKRTTAVLQERELLGFQYSQTLVTDIQALDLDSALAEHTQDNIVLLFSDSDTAYKTLQSKHAHVELTELTEPGNWSSFKDIDSSISTPHGSKLVIGKFS